MSKKHEPTFFDREMRRPGFRKAFVFEKKLVSLEVQVARALKEAGWTYEEFADRIGTAKSHVSRDLNGGLQRSSVQRIQRIAKTLHMRYVQLLIPENKADKIVPQILALVGSQ